MARAKQRRSSSWRPTSGTSTSPSSTRWRSSATSSASTSGTSSAAPRPSPSASSRLRPGLGVGGHGAPVDTIGAHRPLRLVELAGQVNERMPQYVVQLAATLLNEHGKIGPRRPGSVGSGIMQENPSPGPPGRPPHPDCPPPSSTWARWSATTTPTSPTRRVRELPVPRADSLYEAAASRLTVLLQHHRTYDLQGLSVKAQLLLDTRGATSVVRPTASDPGTAHDQPQAPPGPGCAISSGFPGRTAVRPRPWGIHSMSQPVPPPSGNPFANGGVPGPYPAAPPPAPVRDNVALELVAAAGPSDSLRWVYGALWRHRAADRLGRRRRRLPRRSCRRQGRRPQPRPAGRQRRAVPCAVYLGQIVGIAVLGAKEFDVSATQLFLEDFGLLTEAWNEGKDAFDVPVLRALPPSPRSRERRRPPVAAAVPTPGAPHHPVRGPSVPVPQVSACAARPRP
ncbi:hypothetical protein SNARM312S_03027 [Streptomyces narbonensis]